MLAKLAFMVSILALIVACGASDDTGASHHAGATGGSVAKGGSGGSGIGGTANGGTANGGTANGGTANGGMGTGAAGAGATGAAGGGGSSAGGSGAGSGTGGSSGQSALAALAASMAPGTWAELSTSGASAAFTSADWGGGASNDIFYYSDNARWDPTSHAVMFLGGDHNWSIPSTAKFIQYAESSNAWSTLPLSWGAVTHGYDHVAIDPARRFYYFRAFNSPTVRRYDIDTQAWSQLPDWPYQGSDYLNCCDALEYFPEMDALLWIAGNGTAGQSNGHIYAFHESTNQWTTLSSNVDLAGTWNLAEYNPVLHVMIFYSAETGALYELDAAGTITKLKDPPVSLYNGTNGLLTVDPVSGDYIALAGDSLTPQKYDVQSDTWTALSSTNAPDFSGPAGVVAAPISTYGVILFAVCAAGGSDNCGSVWLYKHSG